MELFIGDATEPADTIFYNPEAESTDIRDNKTGQEFEFDWTITEKGQYTLTVVATLRTKWGEGVGDPLFDNYDDTITVVVYQQDVDVELPAAPAIAARILKHNEVQARFGRGNSGGNFIKEVARHMGPQTYFYYEEFGDTENNYSVPKTVWQEVDV